MFNYATKWDIKNISHVNTSSFALKKFGRLDIDKLILGPVNLSKLIAVVKNDVFKKALYDKLVEK